MDVATTLSAALRERYRIERELGQGGMATVYLAQDLKHDRKVAVKVLKPELAAILGADRFLAEIKVTANLQHPNLLPLFDSGEADGLLYYVMPYVDGETLRTRLEREQQLPVEETLRIAGLLAGALDYAHQHGVVHRDLKPENILLQSGQPVIADFGIALAVAHAGGSRITQTGLSLGTPAYMSPEQATGDRVIDARSDQYSLAAVLYEMLTGETPHMGGTAQAIIARLMTEKPRSVRSTRPNVPVPVDVAIARGLAKAPADRFATCGALAAALVSDPARAPRRQALVAAAWFGLALLALLAWKVLSRKPAAATSSAPRSIAVLPLVNVGGDSTQEYFADGMAEELANALGKVPGLRVAARTSTYAFKGRRDLDIKEVGQKLGVGAVLEGSVRRAGERVKVSVQLIDAHDGLELWSESYDQPLRDVFVVQDSITRAIVGRLSLELHGAQLAAASSGRTVNPEAHDLYLQGLSLVHVGSEPAIRHALEYFRKALDRDPGYAQVWVGISWAYAFLADAYQVPAVAYDSARRAALEAQRRGSETGEGLAVLAYAGYASDWDIAKAGAEMQRAVAVSPNSADVAWIHANWLCLTGKIDVGLAEADRGVQLDPLSPLPRFVREWCLYLARRYDEVITEHAKVSALDQNFIYLDSFAGAAYREQGKYEAALAEYRHAQGYMGELPMYGFAITYARMGKLKEAREVLDQLLAYGRSHYVNPIHVALVYTSLGEKDPAFDWLNRAVQDQTVLVAGLKEWPELDALRSDSRFAVLLKRVGLAAP